MTDLAYPDPGPAADQATPPWPPCPARPAGPGEPDPRLLAALARACGVEAWGVRPVGGKAGRVWLLEPVDAGRQPPAGSDTPLVLKLAPSPVEVGLLSAAPALGLPAPAVVAWGAYVGQTPTAASGTPPRRGGCPAVPAALCLRSLPGRPLAEHLHADAAIPTETWAEAIAAVHAATGPALAAGLVPVFARVGRPAEVASARAAAWRGILTRRSAAQLQPLLQAACERLTSLAAAAPDSGDPVLCHGAWFPEHVFVSAGAVVGVVDWEGAVWAPPAYDLATAVVGLFAAGLSARAALALGDALAEAYAAASGRQLRALPFYVALLALERVLADLQGGAGPSALASAWAALLALCLQGPEGAGGTGVAVWGPA